MSMIRREQLEHGVRVVTFDRPDSSANIFDRVTMEELDEHVRAIANNPDVTGVIFQSAKPGIFIAGADLHAISTYSESELSEMIAFGQAVFQRVEELKVPTVAAIHGACVGGGYELALACDWRVATDARATKIGLPETKIGILPAWGGCTRLPALTGPAVAYDVILGGKTVPARSARKRGMIDMIAPRELLLRAARKLLKRGCRDHGRRLDHAKARVMAPLVRRKVLKATGGHYPAPLAALEVIAAGGGHERERAAVLRLAATEASRNLIRIFFLQERARKQGGARGPKVGQAVVIGAGVMGAGIAQWLSARGVRVILKDIDATAVARGMKNIAKLYDHAVKRRILSRTEARSGLDRIAPTISDVPMTRAGMVIEAAVEKLGPKQKIFAALDAPEAVLATNTSALSINEIAAATSDPGRVVGLHFFNPVHRMQLVEVVRGRETRDEVVARAVQFAQQIGKFPIVVADSPGFLVNRILTPYLAEAGVLFEQGADASEVDAAMRDFGMPMGPLRLIDEVGLDIAADVVGTLHQAFPERIETPQILGAMIEKGWLGRKSGRGFYEYKGRKESPNRRAEALRIGDFAGSSSRRQLKRLLVLLLVNESARCLEEGIVHDAADVDFGMIMGTGFAPFRGGPLRFAQAHGIARLVEEMNAVGGLVSPCASLRRMAETGAKFYED